MEEASGGIVWRGMGGGFRGSGRTTRPAAHMVLVGEGKHVVLSRIVELALPEGVGEGGRTMESVWPSNFVWSAGLPGGGIRPAYWFARAIIKAWDALIRGLSVGARFAADSWSGAV